jgi:hypothetical protein
MGAIVWRRTALRTHYTPSQRAMFAAERATRPQGVRNQLGKDPDLPPPRLKLLGRSAQSAESRATPGDPAATHPEDLWKQIS